MMQDDMPTQAEIDGVARVFAEAAEDAVAQASAIIMAKKLKRVFQPSQVVKDLVNERERQVVGEGWSAEHDDGHPAGAIALAAACYAISGAVSSPISRSELTNEFLSGDPVWGGRTVLSRLWPWQWSWFKPKDRRRDLVRAGALILAEIERLDRAAAARERDA